MIALMCVIAFAATCGSIELACRLHQAREQLVKAEVAAAALVPSSAPATDDFTSRFPPAYDAETLIRRIFTIAAQRHVRIASARSGEVGSIDGMMGSATLDVRAVGAYADVRALAFDLLRDDPGLVLDHLTMRADDSPDGGPTAPGAVGTAQGVNASIGFRQWLRPMAASAAGQ